MIYGWIGKVLRVDLTTGTIKTEDLNREWAEAYLGCRGLGVRYYVDEVAAGVDALSPENKLIFATGPMTGLVGTSTGRYEVVAKSPLTNTIAGSNSGGHFGPELKFAGFDLLILEGKAKKPTYLLIEDGHAELRSAEALWGMTTSETTAAITAETSTQAKIACVGPAGEKAARIASIMNDQDRAAGRGGMGAVMGSKNLKAIAVIGRGGIEVADREKALAIAKEARATIKANEVSGQGLKALGTNVLVKVINSAGGLPTRNFRDSVFEHADDISGEKMAENQLVKPKSCFGCSISCSRVTEVKTEKYKCYGEGPEYETTWSFGADCGVDNMDAVIKANYLCNELGIDTISMGSTIACAIDLFRDGHLTREDVGFDLRFNDPDTVLRLVEMTGNGHGFGARLGDGSYRLAESCGQADYSMSVKKLEIPAYDPRAIQGIGLNYATSNNGAAHVRGYTISPEVVGLPEKLDQFSIEDKDLWVKAFQDLTASFDSAGVCLFTTFAIGGRELAEQLAANTGISYTEADILKIGERIHNLEKLYNLAAGFDIKDDQLPNRLTNDPVKAGPARDHVSRVPEMLPAYYNRRGWSKKGVPQPEKLAELGLETLQIH